MKIILEENDSIIQSNGIAQMIVVAVTKDDGKVIRFPYSAGKSMGELIQDVNSKLSNAPPSEARVSAPTMAVAAEIIKELTVAGPGKIQKEDIVKCVKVHDRGKGATVDIQVGGIYRVLKLNMNGPNVVGYDIIDDTDYHKSDIPRRILAFPDEIEFLEKRKTPIPKEIGKFEHICKCETCQKQIIGYRMEDNKYHAKCGECNHVTILEQAA